MNPIKPVINFFNPKCIKFSDFHKLEISHQVHTVLFAILTSIFTLGVLTPRVIKLSIKRFIPFEVDHQTHLLAEKSLIDKQKIKKPDAPVDSPSVPKFTIMDFKDFILKLCMTPKELPSTWEDFLFSTEFSETIVHKMEYNNVLGTFEKIFINCRDRSIFIQLLKFNSLKNRNLFKWLCSTNNEAAVHWILKTLTPQELVIVHESNGLGFTPLGCAIKNDHEKIFRSFSKLFPSELENLHILDVIFTYKANRTLKVFIDYLQQTHRMDFLKNLLERREIIDLGSKVALTKREVGVQASMLIQLMDLYPREYLLQLMSCKDNKANILQTACFFSCFDFADFLIDQFPELIIQKYENSNIYHYICASKNVNSESEILRMNVFEKVFKLYPDSPALVELNRLYITPYERAKTNLHKNLASRLKILGANSKNIQKNNRLRLLYHAWSVEGFDFTQDIKPEEVEGFNGFRSVTALNNEINRFSPLPSHFQELSEALALYSLSEQDLIEALNKRMKSNKLWIMYLDLNQHLHTVYLVGLGNLLILCDRSEVSLTPTSRLVFSRFDGQTMKVDPGFKFFKLSNPSELSAEKLLKIDHYSALFKVLSRLNFIKLKKKNQQSLKTCAYTNCKGAIFAGLLAQNLSSKPEEELKNDESFNAIYDQTQAEYKPWSTSARLDILDSYKKDFGSNSLVEAIKNKIVTKKLKNRIHSN